MLAKALVMMGHWQKQTELWVEPINLGKRIAQDHLLRKINKVLDLGFVRREVAGFYGSNGHVSVDPVIIIKLMLLLFLDNVRSERELMRIVPLRLDYLWFLGYGLEDEIPRHSVLSKARKRWGAHVFERLFVRSVEQCVEAGLVDGDKLYIDASLVAANASRNSVIEVVVQREVSSWRSRTKKRRTPAAEARSIGSCVALPIRTPRWCGTSRASPLPLTKIIRLWMTRLEWSPR